MSELRERGADCALCVWTSAARVLSRRSVHREREPGYCIQCTCDRWTSRHPRRSCPDRWCSSAVAKPLASAPSIAL
ncbi:hypothetical protein [Mesorhizobium sp.]|uniref:hypothetical protein n=1 Tax=Mesorhizobium sp. TaxID=1871066 RepID=UPI00338E9311